jgi:L-threonylcarbamoyladenylate synthase
VKTLRLVLDPERLDTTEAQSALDVAAGILRSGGLVAFPTETVYGLGANALDGAAVARIFAAKQRPSWDPVIVHIAEDSMVDRLVSEIPESARMLIETFWPGPLTLLLPRSNDVPDAVTAGRPLVGIRMPSHPVAFELIRRAGVPVAAPSANMFSRISPTTAAHVLEDLGGRIDAVLDAGPTPHGVESTVLDPGQSPMLIYRPGAITLEQISDVAGAVELYRTESPVEAPEGLPSPGVGMRHYAPRAKLILVDASLDRLPYSLAEAAADYPDQRIGMMLPAELQWEASSETRIFPWGRWSDPEELARNLYAGLRSLDGQECAVILCPLPVDEGIGSAIRDRLRKAARKL